MFKKAVSVFLTTLLLATCLVSAAPVSATEVYYSKAVNMLAEEEFGDYSRSGDTLDKNIINAYNKSTAGEGWKALWSTTPTTFTPPADADKIQFYYLNNYKETSASSLTSTKSFIKLNGMPAGTTAYRQLVETINFDIAGSVYEFSFDVMDTISSAGSNRRSFRFKVGEQFSVGYDRDTNGYTDIIPVIEVGGTPTPSDVKLSMNGGNTNGEFVNFTVRVEIGADGNDTITLTAQDAQKWQRSAVWKNVSGVVSTVTKTTNLSGTANYIGLGSVAGSVTRNYVRDISIREIQTCETSADCVATVNTAIIDGSVAFNKTISADIDVESISGNNANILSVVAIKKSNKLVGVTTAEATLSTDSTTATMPLSYTFSEENGWDAGSFDAEEIGVSFYVWNKDTLTPYINKLGFSAEKYH